METNKTPIWKDTTTQQLAQVLSELKDTAVLQKFLRDVMTEKEIAEISARLEAARMLHAGKRYTDIIKSTRLSSRTIARISEWLKKGTGGYHTAIDIINKSKSTKKKQ